MTVTPDADVPAAATGILRVAVDARFAVLDTRGIGRYTRAVAGQLLGRPEVTLTFVAPGPLAPRGRIAAALDVPPARVVARVPRETAVLWNPSNASDLALAAPAVTMIHDLVPFTFPASNERVRAREQAALVRTAERARRILVNSAATAAEVERVLGVARDCIAVTPLGVAAPFVAAGARHRLADARPYVLHVGAHDPRKNTATLIAAWQRAFPQADVALAFSRPPSRVPAGALVVDAPDDVTLAALYRGALLVAIPSLDEGFGIPVLEAMAHGADRCARRVLPGSAAPR